jgi:hypothetical protein
MVNLDVRIGGDGRHCAAAMTTRENSMKTIRFRGAALALFLTVALAGHAQATPASRASLQALFQLLHADTMVDGVYGAMQKSMSQMFAQDARQRGESPARQRIEAKAMEDMMGLVRAEYNWGVMEPDMIDAYQKTFTEEEVTGMINFYSTPVGQATITKIPQLTQTVLAGSQARLQALLPRIRAIAEKARADADAADAAH